MTILFQNALVIATLLLLLPLTGTVVFGSLEEVPEILGSSNYVDDWQVIRSTQTIERHPEIGGRKIVLEVEDYFRIHGRATYSKVRDVAKDQAHVVLSQGGKTFVHDGASAWQLDLRHDHTTMFPWLGRCSHYGMSMKSNVLGVPGLWVNAMERDSRCTRLDATYINCFYESRPLKVSVEMKFRWPLGEGAERLTSLASAVVDQRRTISSANSTLFQDVRTIVTVNSVDSRVSSEMISAIEGAIDECKHSLDDAPIFPSLMRRLTLSSERNYLFKYQVKFYDLNGDQAQVSKKYTMNEWFSYELETQTFEPGGSGAKFYRLLNLRQHGTDTSACYRLRTGRLVPDECAFSEFADDMLSVSDLTRRKMHFVLPLANNSQVFRSHTGNLLGLGALLMNVADIQYRQISTVENQATLSSKSDKFDEMIVKGHAPGQRIHLRFMRRNTTVHGERDMEHLFSVSIYRVSDNMSLGEMEDDDIFYSETTKKSVMRIDISSFRVSLSKQEIEQALILPSICPRGDFEEALDVLKPEPESGGTTTPVPGEDNFMDAIEEAYTFPTLEEHLELARDYSIASKWISDAGHSIELSENFVIDGHLSAQDEQGFHFARLDVWKEAHKEREKYFISYLTGAVIRVTDKSCEQHAITDYLIARLSGEFQFGGQSTEARDSRASPRHYGVGGLWALGSRSPHVEFLGEYEESAGEKFTLWQLENDPELQDVVLVFNFSQLVKADGDYRFKYRLNSIQATINEAADRVSMVTIIPESMKVGAIDSVRFLLPPICDPTVESDYIFRLPKFPAFAQSFGGRPTEISFEFSYDLSIYAANALHSLKVVEANKLDWNGIGLVQAEWSAGKFRIWLKPSGETLLEQVASKKCKRGPDPVRFVLLSDYVDTIIDGKQEIGECWSNFLLANIWNLLSARVELEGSSSGMMASVNYKYLNGEHVRYIQWSMDSGDYRFSISFIHSHTEDQLLLDSLAMTKHDSDNYVAFKVKSSSKSPSSLKKLVMPVECAHAESSKKFPQLAGQYETGDVLHVKSEIIKLNGVGRFFAEEWLQVGSSMRTKLTRPGHETDPALADYLIYNNTQEFFNLSKSFHCASDDLDKSSLRLASDDWMSDCLYRAGDKALFYGPLSLWTLAGRLTMRTELVHAEVDFLVMRDDPTRLDNWFSSECWLVSHPDNDLWTYKIVFNLNSNGKRHILPERIQATDWHRPKATGQMELNVDILQVFSYQSNKAHEVSGKFLIPVGFGCKRGGKATRDFLLQSKNDALVFDVLIPGEFEYKASLRLIGNESRVVEPAIVSGYFGRCPDKWNLEGYGAFKVRNQHLLYVNGTTKSETSMDFREKPGQDQAERRVLDDMSGICTIWRDSSKHDELFQLDFGRAKINVTSRLISFAASRDTEVIRFIQGDFSNGWRDIVVYEDRFENLQFGQEFSGTGSLVRTFERNLDMTVHGMMYYHSDARIDLYLSGQAHLSLEVKNLRMPSCYEILKKAPTESCSESSRSRLASVDSNDPPNNKRELRIKFETKHGEKLADFSMKSITIEALIVDRLMELKRGWLRALQFGQVKVQMEDKRQLIADIRLVAQSPAVDRFVRVARFAIKREPSIGPIKTTNSARSCSDLCESTGNCFSFSYCERSRECQVLNVDSWRHDMVRDFKPAEKFNFTENLQSALRVAENCTTYYSPSGQPIKTLDSVIEMIRQETELGQINITIMNESNFDLVQYTATETQELRSFADERIGNDRVARKSSYNVIESGSKMALAKLKSGEIPEVHPRLTYTNSAADCLDLCSAVSCDLASFCATDRICVVADNITSWPIHGRVLEEAKLTKSDCMIFGRDYLADFHRFSNTMKPKGYMSLIEGVSLVECATRCHFTEGRLEANDCLSFDFCPRSGDGGGGGDNKPDLGNCYIQRLHLVMDDFDESILRQAIADPSSQCNHFSKSLIADYQLLACKRFSNRQGLALRGTTLDACALICRRNDDCIAFEFCKSHQEEKFTSCYMSKQIAGPANESEPQVMETSSVCDIYQVKHIGAEFDVQLGASYGAITLPEASGFASLAHVCLYLGGSVLLGLVLSVAFNKLTGSPVQLSALSPCPNKLYTRRTR